MDLNCNQGSESKTSTIGKKKHKVVCVYQDTRPRLGLEALKMSRQNRAIAKARLEAKKQRMKYGIPNKPSHHH